ncbi:helix-turn-helix domain-containing protein [Nocardia sp. NPDC051832]|uniref:TetR/AcrR family transcriptional regulator n=1 Tax=Nocardia sp. NPDC051832 TaxID=3155673 RepID=UPI0034498A13
MPAASKPPVTPKDADDSIESRILDAALVQFEMVGFKKTTIEDVARRAGVDRVTVYRRVGSRDDLVQAVVSREVGAVLAELAKLPSRHDNAADLVADMFVTVLSRWRQHALAQRMMTLEPERVIASLTTEGATAFTVSVAAAAAAMQQAVELGLLPELPDVMTRMEVACRVVHSFILLPDITVRFESDSAMADFARTYLLPIVTGS